MKRTTLLTITLLALTACSGGDGPVSSGSARSAISEAAHTAKKRLGRDGPDPFIVRVDLTDPYGNASQQDALRFEWLAITKSKINRSSIDQYQLVDLATVEVLSPWGTKAFAEWCDDNGRTLTPRLCSTERQRAETAWAAPKTVQPDDNMANAADQSLITEARTAIGGEFSDGWIVLSPNGHGRAVCGEKDGVRFVYREGATRPTWHDGTDFAGGAVDSWCAPSTRPKKN
nr:hypothetical protein [uncultured Brevundimonas sp.]